MATSDQAQRPPSEAPKARIRHRAHPGDRSPPTRPSGQHRITCRSSLQPARARDISFDQLPDAIAAGDLIWVDLLQPEPALLDALQEHLLLESLTVEDCLLPVRMPKFDPLPEGAFVAACAVGIDQIPSPRLLARPISFVVGQRYLLTVWHGDASIVGERLDTMFGEESELPEQSGAGLAHGVLDAVVDRHLPVMIRAAEIAEDLDDLLDPQNERKSLAPLEELIVLRRDLLAFRRIGVAQQEVLRRFGRRFPSLHSYLSDVADNQREAIDTATATCDYIDGAIEAFRVGREARTGFRLRQLTVLAAILGPLSLVTALWGLNFSNIPGVESAAGWYVFVAIQLLYVLSVVVYFRLRGLL